ncbi:hypothetical protein HDE_12657 [Halotydeus destructor]|nr:hypothetical protein HDE_12657 [Halotydeus destructor]
MYNRRRFVVGSVLAALSWALAVLSVSALDDLMTDNQLGFALCQHNPSAEYLYHKLYNCSRSNSSHEERMVSSACFKKVFKVDAFPANFKEMKIIICDKDNINVTDKMAALDSCQTELGQAKYDVTAAKMTMLVG